MELSKMGRIDVKCKRRRGWERITEKEALDAVARMTCGKATGLEGLDDNYDGWEGHD